MDTCPQCGRPYGKRRRCYFCHGKKRTGETRACDQCGAPFYVERNVLNDTVRHAGHYCSRACQGEAMRGRISRAARPEEALRSPEGYVLVWAPDHPRASRGRVFEHIIVAEAMLGRPLAADERVHHRDHNRANNAPDNLQVLSNSAHSALHAAEQQPFWQAQRVTLTCPECGQSFTVKRSRGQARNPRNQRTYCSTPCRLQALHRAAAAYHQRQRDAKAQPGGDAERGD